MTKIKEISFDDLFNRPTRGETIPHVDVVKACKDKGYKLHSVGVRPLPLSGMETVAIVSGEAA